MVWLANPACCALLIPYVGWVVGWFLTPLSWLVVSAAYVQQVREHADELTDILPQGFAVAQADAAVSATSIEVAALVDVGASADAGAPQMPAQVASAGQVPSQAVSAAS